MAVALLLRLGQKPGARDGGWRTGSRGRPCGRGGSPPGTGGSRRPRRGRCWPCRRGRGGVRPSCRCWSGPFSSSFLSLFLLFLFLEVSGELLFPFRTARKERKGGGWLGLAWVERGFSNGGRGREGKTSVTVGTSRKGETNGEEYGEEKKERKQERTAG